METTMPTTAITTTPIINTDGSIASNFLINSKYWSGSELYINPATITIATAANSKPLPIIYRTRQLASNIFPTRFFILSIRKFTSIWCVHSDRCGVSLISFAQWIFSHVFWMLLKVDWAVSISTLPLYHGSQ